MNMRVIKIVTRLQPEEAHTLIGFLDEVRDTLMQTYGTEIRAMLRAAATTRESGVTEEDEAPF